VDGAGAAPRAWVGERPVVAAAEEERGAVLVHARARLVEVHGPVLGGDDAAARPVGDVLGEHHLALERNDPKLREQLAREGVRRHDDAPGDDAALRSRHRVAVGRFRYELQNREPRVELDPAAQRAVEQPAGVRYGW
jgi:hypothetical protein